MPVQPLAEMHSENRLKSFKYKRRNLENQRQHRARVSIQLRKQRKDDLIFKRRHIVLGTVSLLLENEVEMTFHQVLAGIFSDDARLQFRATQCLRMILSSDLYLPIDEIISADVIPRLVCFLGRQKSVNLQFEAAWVLTNVASGTSEQTASVVNAGAIPCLIALLSSQSTSVVDQAVWALGNIAGDSAKHRDHVLKNGALPHLLKLAKSDVELCLLRQVTRTLTNLCSDKFTAPPLEVMLQCLPVFADLINNEDVEIVGDSCLALCYFTNDDYRIETVLRSGVVPRLIDLLGVCQESVVVPAIHAVGNIISGDDSQIQAVIDAGGLQALANLIRHTDPNVVLAATWAVSSIAAGNDRQIQEIIETGIAQSLVQILISGDYKSRIEAIWAVMNFTDSGSVIQISYLARSRVIEPLCQLLSIEDPEVVFALLIGLHNILKATTKLNYCDIICYWIEKCGGLDKIEALQNHENKHISMVASSIVEYFSSTEEVEDENVSPNVNGTEGFQFSMPSEAPKEGFSF